MCVCMCVCARGEQSPFFSTCHGGALWVGVVSDKELKLEDGKASHTLGGAGAVGT